MRTSEAIRYLDICEEIMGHDATLMLLKWSNPHEFVEHTLYSCNRFNHMFHVRASNKVWEHYYPIHIAMGMWDHFGSIKLDGRTA